MIEWRVPLYVSDSAREKKRKLMSDIRAHRLHPGAYVIVLAANGTDLLDLIPAFMLSKDGYRGHSIRVLGLAIGRKDAMELAARMIGDVYDKTGGFDVRGYFS